MQKINLKRQADKLLDKAGFTHTGKLAKKKAKFWDINADIEAEIDGAKERAARRRASEENKS